jgi:hypothetical protein
MDVKADGVERFWRRQRHRALVISSVVGVAVAVGVAIAARADGPVVAFVEAVAIGAVAGLIFGVSFLLASRGLDSLVEAHEPLSPADRKEVARAVRQGRAVHESRLAWPAVTSARRLIYPLGQASGSRVARIVRGVLSYAFGVFVIVRLIWKHHVLGCVAGASVVLVVVSVYMLRGRALRAEAANGKLLS